MSIKILIPATVMSLFGVGATAVAEASSALPSDGAWLGWLFAALAAFLALLAKREADRILGVPEKSWFEDTAQAIAGIQETLLGMRGDRAVDRAIADDNARRIARLEERLERKP